MYLLGVKKKKKYKDVLLRVLLQCKAVVPQKVKFFWPLFFCVAWMSVRFPGLKLRPSPALLSADSFKTQLHSGTGVE